MAANWDRGIEIALTTRDEELAFASGHVLILALSIWSASDACSCGWVGDGWAAHVDSAYVRWLAERRAVLRERLLREEGVSAP